MFRLGIFKIEKLMLCLSCRQAGSQTLLRQCDTEVITIFHPLICVADIKPLEKYNDLKIKQYYTTFVKHKGNRENSIHERYIQHSQVINDLYGAEQVA